MRSSSRVFNRYLACALLLVAVTSASAQSQRPNIILYLADDLDWTDLPYFNPPPVWEDENAPYVADPNVPSASWLNQSEPSEFRRRTPDLNRFAARAFAQNDRTLGRFPENSPSGPRVVPIDVARDASNNDTLVNSSEFAYANPDDHSENCRKVADAQGLPPNGGSNPDQLTVFFKPCATRDILHGFGGLRRLATEGAIFPRVYSASALCEPARASILTGRSVDRTGVSGNGSTVKPPYNGQVGGDFLVAQYLRNKGYTTGLVAKFGLGSSSPQDFGFDEYVAFSGHSRDYFSKGNLSCATVPRCKSDNTLACGSCPAGDECVGLAQYIGPQPAAPPNSADGHPPYCSVGNLDSPGKDPWCCFSNEHRYKASPGTVASKYAFKPKVKDPSNPNSPLLWKYSEGPSSLVCNDDGDVFSTGCAYSTRWERDVAINFLLRHRADSKPFFLMVSSHAPHVEHFAPERTKAHYHTPNTSSPDGGEAYWAILEEMDAAVGKILETMDSKFCKGTSLDGQMGKPCTSNTDCSGDTCTTLADNTYIFFTSDHGRKATFEYGDPLLRGGKGNIYEGGIKVGLLARGPDITAGRRLPETRVASLTDLFATFAEIADPTDVDDAGAPGHLDSNPPPTGTQYTYGWVEGRSMLPVLRETNGTPASDNLVRDYVFAKFDTPRTIVTRQGYFDEVASAHPGISYATGICGVALEEPYDLSCITNTDCRNGKTCDAAGYPAHTCSETLGAVCPPDCDAGDGCQAGRCKPTCTDNADCPAAFACDSSGAPPWFCSRAHCSPGCPSGSACSLPPLANLCAPLARTHRAASCKPCSTDITCRTGVVCSAADQCGINTACLDSDPTTPGNQLQCVPMCKITAGVCIPEDGSVFDSEHDACVSMVTESARVACHYQTRPRCNAKEDCETGYTCEAIKVPCETCMDAAWKASGAEDNSQTFVVNELYDLSTNIEESDADLGEQTSLNCATSSNVDVMNVKEELRTALSVWKAAGVADSPCDGEDYRHLTPKHCQ